MMTAGRPRERGAEHGTAGQAAGGHRQVEPEGGPGADPGGAGDGGRRALPRERGQGGRVFPHQSLMVMHLSEFLFFDLSDHDLLPFSLICFCLA